MPKAARLLCVFLGTLALLSAWQLDSAYWDGVDKLPTLVDAQGHTASVEVAMQSLDSYQHLQRYHTFSIASVVVGVLLFGCYGVSTSQRARSDVA